MVATQLQASVQRACKHMLRSTLGKRVRGEASCSCFLQLLIKGAAQVRGSLLVAGSDSVLLGNRAPAHALTSPEYGVYFSSWSEVATDVSSPSFGSATSGSPLANQAATNNRSNMN